MEQLYLMEVFIDTITIIPTEDDNSGSKKKLILKVRFGPRVELIYKENQIIGDDKIPEDKIDGRNWTRSFRIGKSYLFVSDPETLLQELKLYPLQMELWTDDEKEKEIFVGVGYLSYNTGFLYLTKESLDTCHAIKPLTIKDTLALNAECCCRVCAMVNFILRISPLGGSVTSSFQQLMKDPKIFVFKTEAVPSLYECKRIDGDSDSKIVGSLYEDTIKSKPAKKPSLVNVCTDFAICTTPESVCKEDAETKEQKLRLEEFKTGKKREINTVKMGEIFGPCGNRNCPLAHRVKNYIRQLDTYKRNVIDNTPTEDQQEGKKTKTICGKCICKSGRWKREKCSGREPIPKDADKITGICEKCHGFVGTGKSCEQRRLEAGGSQTMLPKNKSNTPQNDKANEKQTASTNKNKKEVIAKKDPKSPN